jgi:hypothetical protein
MSGHERVINAIEDRYSDERKASKVGDIVDWTGLSESEVRDVVDDLNGNQILSIYEGDGDPTVYVT